MSEEQIRLELAEVFTIEKLESLTKQETDIMIQTLNEKWISFTKEMLTEVDHMNITIETDNITDVLWSTYNNIVPLLCLLVSIRETDCKYIRMIPNFRAITRDVKFLLKVVGNMKSVKLNLNVTNIFGALMHRIASFNNEQRSWLLGYKECISDNSKAFLDSLREMIKSELNHLNFFAPMEVEREKYLYRLYTNTLQNKENAENVLYNLVEIQTQVESLLVEKKACIEATRETVQAVLDKHFDLRLRSRIDQEAKMVKLGQEFKGRKQILLVQVQEKSHEYQTFTEKNVKSFQKISDVKFKKESNCINWIQKYDTEAAARQLVLDDLYEQEAKLNEQIEDYKQKLLEQDEPWNTYMDAKREDIRQALRIKVINRAAGRIQTWWRNVWKKILKRRKIQKKRLASVKKKKGF